MRILRQRRMIHGHGYYKVDERIVVIPEPKHQADALRMLEKMASSDGWSQIAFDLSHGEAVDLVKRTNVHMLDAREVAAEVVRILAEGEYVAPKKQGKVPESAPMMEVPEWP